MSEPMGAGQTSGMIGPNAVLQLVPLLDRAGGTVWRQTLLACAGLDALPDGLGMIPEVPVIRLHQALRRDLPDLAADLGWQAGLATAEYILAHRIPKAAQLLLKILPWRLSARLLSLAIARNAWTFAGSGQFLVLSPLVFELRADLPPLGPSIITRVCGFEIGSRVCRSGQARRAWSHQIAQALGALQRVFCCPAMSVA